jgi:hypothetical protein
VSGVVISNGTTYACPVEDSDYVCVKARSVFLLCMGSRFPFGEDVCMLSDRFAIPSSQHLHSVSNLEPLSSLKHVLELMAG